MLRCFAARCIKMARSRSASTKTLALLWASALARQRALMRVAMAPKVLKKPAARKNWQASPLAADTIEASSSEDDDDARARSQPTALDAREIDVVELMARGVQPRR